ncbi:MAG: HPr family phosphocarrier protein [Microbacteriaceae bacterium]|nr:HPr family phosphocarrier protein [Microbacteriaceae bacterium]
MISRGEALVSAREGLHARPAANFVRSVELSGHEVTVSNSAGLSASGSSILGVLSLGIKHGEKVSIQVSGPDADKVLESLIAVVSGANQG